MEYCIIKSDKFESAEATERNLKNAVLSKDVDFHFTDKDLFVEHRPSYNYSFRIIISFNGLTLRALNAPNGYSLAKIMNYYDELSTDELRELYIKEKEFNTKQELSETTLILQEKINELHKLNTKITSLKKEVEGLEKQKGQNITILNKVEELSAIMKNK